MKSIKAIRASKNVEVGQIKRINDVEAESRVRGGNWTYVPKSEWKANKASAKEAAATSVEQTTEEMVKKPYKKGAKTENQ